MRGTADGDRAVSGRVKKIAPSESDLLIRQSKAERRTAIINAGLSEVRATEQEPANESATVGTAIERGRAALTPGHGWNAGKAPAGGRGRICADRF